MKFLTSTTFLLGLALTLCVLPAGADKPAQLRGKDADGRAPIPAPLRSQMPGSTGTKLEDSAGTNRKNNRFASGLTADLSALQPARAGGAAAWWNGIRRHTASSWRKGSRISAPAAPPATTAAAASGAAFHGKEASPALLRMVPLADKAVKTKVIIASALPLPESEPQEAALSNKTAAKTAAAGQRKPSAGVAAAKSGEELAEDAVIELKPGELDILAKVIYAEARGESFEGQVAVGAVIVNRIQSSLFPDTIREVVFQRNAFTAINDGQYRLKPDAIAYRAAREALRGKDPTDEALYYYNPNTATSRWIRSRTATAHIGNHRFAR